MNKQNVFNFFNNPEGLNCRLKVEYYRVWERGFVPAALLGQCTPLLLLNVARGPRYWRSNVHYHKSQFER